LGIGLAMPGPFDVESMSFVGPTTLESWRGVAVAQRLSERTGLAAFVETDMVSAARGESLHGTGRNVRAFYYLYFGVGLGGSMVKDGVPLRGFYGNAGEIGHVPMVPNGQPCSCGNTGCLERYVSLEAYQRRAPVIGHAALTAAIEPLPTSVADRKDRSAPRIMRSASGQDAVLRGAASLAFSGVLSPRLGRAENLEKDPLFARSRVA
ncbi:MAG: transcriptional regulator, partial [Alphaproteobacteria bacterium PA3]